MTEATRFQDHAGEGACSLCRAAARAAATVYGEQVCLSCLRRLNADLGAKRAIMFAMQN